MSSTKATKATQAQAQGEASDVQAPEQEAPVQAPQAPQEGEQEAPQGEGQGEAQEGVSEGEAQATYSASEVAAMAGASAKDFRRWMRASVRAIGAGDALPGKGGRYAYSEQEAQALALAYGRATKAKGTRAPASLLLAALAPKAPEGEAPKA